MIKNKLKAGLVSAFAMMIAMTGFASAADLTYSTATTIDLTTADFTISSGSTAETVVVNADSVVVTMGAGDTFTITSASRGLNVSGSNAGISVSITCSSSLIDTAVINSSTGTGSYTITPASSQCTYVTGGGGIVSPIPTSTTGQAAATPANGGVISKTNSDGTSAKVVLPAGALTANAVITISPTAKAEVVASMPAPSGRNIVGNYAYNFTAVSGLNTAVNTFEKALSLTFTYTNEQAEGLSEGTMKIYYWDETSEEWIALEDSTVNTTTNTVTATTTHFTYFAILGVQAEEEEPTITEVLDGDIIQCASSSNPFAVYIVKEVGDTKYIRHIVSIEIFDYYTHLKWENLKQVNSLASFSLSGWVRVNTGPEGTPGPTDKVYEINGDQTKHWINMTAEQFLAHGGSDAAIYSVNQGELDLYTVGADVMML